jgi:hypothetical protein
LIGSPSNAIMPGASIQTGGDLNTLDVLTNLTLNGGTDIIKIGRDLNLLNVGGNITLSGGSKIQIGRDLGLVLQPPKGTGTGTNVLSLNVPLVGPTASPTQQQAVIPVSTYIQGDVTINATSEFRVVHKVDSQMYMGGLLSGNGKLDIPNLTLPSPAPSNQTINALGGNNFPPEPIRLTGPGRWPARSCRDMGAPPSVKLFDVIPGCWGFRAS